MARDLVQLPSVTIATIAATSAKSGEELVDSWVGSLNSAHSRRNFETTAKRFLATSPSRSGRRRSRTCVQP